ncbi:MAG: hypothetical protein A6F70_04460 [Cycloclasticus sp. symbiont of Bathymodiolus heckerae]|nr:MAG: hypothetical protein A6F70_04460 [Cycloclasticus sp. symbiont of Bathymodiolus heckerae]
MNNTNKEQISSLLDNELDYSQTLDLMNALESDASLSKRLDRYALIRGALNEGSVTEDDSFLKNIQESLKSQPTVLAPRHKRQENKKYVAVALAASVAIFSVTIFDMGLFTNTAPTHHSIASIEAERSEMLALEEQQNEDARLDDLNPNAQLVTFEK